MKERVRLGTLVREPLVRLLFEPVPVAPAVRTGDPFRIQHLLPGFEILRDSVRGKQGAAGCDYVDLREDRAVFYATIPTTAQTITYQIKATNRGEFIVPPPYAESMYERGLNARGVAGKITVVDAK
jgi:uncharacterized protein YfaS (alpha-2-macroglobulin family)